MSDANALETVKSVDTSSEVAPVIEACLASKAVLIVPLVKNLVLESVGSLSVSILISSLSITKPPVLFRLTPIPPLLPISRPPPVSITTFNWLPIFSRAIPAVTCPALENCVNAKSCVPTVASVSLVQTNPILSLVVPCSTKTKLPLASLPTAISVARIQEPLSQI